MLLHFSRSKSAVQRPQELGIWMSPSILNHGYVGMRSGFWEVVVSPGVPSHRDVGMGLRSCHGDSVCWAGWERSSSSGGTGAGEAGSQHGKHGAFLQQVQICCLRAPGANQECGMKEMVERRKVERKGKASWGEDLKSWKSIGKSLGRAHISPWDRGTGQQGWL